MSFPKTALFKTYIIGFVICWVTGQGKLLSRTAGHQAALPQHLQLKIGAARRLPNSASPLAAAGESFMKVYHKPPPKGILNYANTLLSGWPYRDLTEPHGEQLVPELRCNPTILTGTKDLKSI